MDNTDNCEQRLPFLCVYCSLSIMICYKAIVCCPFSRQSLSLDKIIFSAPMVPRRVSNSSALPSQDSKEARKPCQSQPQLILALLRSRNHCLRFSTASTRSCIFILLLARGQTEPSVVEERRGVLRSDWKSGRKDVLVGPRYGSKILLNLPLNKFHLNLSVNCTVVADFGLELCAVEFSASYVSL